MMKRPSGGRGKELAAVAPLLNEITQDVLYDKVWERPQLSKRDRSLITITTLIALNRNQIEGHMELGIENGLTVEELGEAISHLAFYAGWPCAVNAARALMSVAQKHEGASRDD
jgi:4-carboxymuconolactone decarboxylase